MESYKYYSVSVLPGSKMSVVTAFKLNNDKRGYDAPNDDLTIRRHSNPKLLDAHTKLLEKCGYKRVQGIKLYDFYYSKEKQSYHITGYDILNTGDATIISGLHKSCKNKDDLETSKYYLENRGYVKSVHINVYNVGFDGTVELGNLFIPDDGQIIYVPHKRRRIENPEERHNYLLELVQQGFMDINHALVINKEAKNLKKELKEQGRY